MPAPAPVVPLMEELIEEILLRFPPHEPSFLIRAALVCKQWCRLVSGAGFRRRFREFHRTPPVLGFLYCSCNYSSSKAQFVPGSCNAQFVPTAANCPPIAYPACRMLDARHGRVLLLAGPKNALVIWDPIADEQRKLPAPKPWHSLLSWNAAVLCAAHGSCDHLDCHRRSFLVVFLCTDFDETTICTYSSDTCTWSYQIDIDGYHSDFVQPFKHSALVGNAVYFRFHRGEDMILKYELESHEMSVIDLPQPHNLRHCDVLTTMVDGGLGFATLYDSKLYIWSRKDGLGVDAGWRQNRVIDFEMPLLSNAISTLPDVVGIVDEIGVIFLRTKTNRALFTFDLKTYKVKKICQGRIFDTIFPFMSFYTPALGAACRGKGPGGSSA